MFGNADKPKPPVLKPRPVPKICDVTGDRCNFGHIARQPNTCYNVEFMNYLRAKDDATLRVQQNLLKEVTEANIMSKTQKHNEKMSYKRSLNEKVDKKMEEYDAGIEERRKRLGELFWKEERELLREVLVEVQKERDLRAEEQVVKLKSIRERKEAERQAIVEEKRLQQYLDRSAECRPVLAHQRLLESKQIQLLQIKEIEAKRKSEEEEDHFWHQMQLKYCEAIDEREENDRLNKNRLVNEMRFYLDLQMKNKEAQERKRKQEIIEEGVQLDKLRKELQEEERAYLEKSHKSKKQLLESFNAQIKEHREILQRISDQERKIQEAYDTLAKIEIEKDRAKRMLVISRAGEVLEYQKYVAELKRQQAEQEKYTDKQIEEAMKEIQRTEDGKKCEAELAKQALKEAVIQGRQQQREDNRIKQEQLKKLQELENEFENALHEQNTKLRAEFERQLMLKEKQYREDLKQQMKYQKERKDREEANDKMMLDTTVDEEKLYKKIVAEVLSGKIKICETHPFRYVINEEKCPCPKPNY